MFSNQLHIYQSFHFVLYSLDDTYFWKKKKKNKNSAQKRIWRHVSSEILICAVVDGWMLLFPPFPIFSPPPFPIFFSPLLSILTSVHSPGSLRISYSRYDIYQFEIAKQLFLPHTLAMVLFNCPETFSLDNTRILLSLHVSFQREILSWKKKIIRTSRSLYRYVCFFVRRSLSFYLLNRTTTRQKEISLSFPERLYLVEMCFFWDKFLFIYNSCLSLCSDRTKVIQSRNLERLI